MAIPAEALERLKAVLARAESDAEIHRIVKARDEVLARYQSVFHPRRISELQEMEFRSFLYFENNQHWTGLTRQITRLTADMDLLREALAALLDEDRPLAKRFDQALESVKGLGKALATAILLVAYPDRYGVWNNTSEAALKALDLWPSFDRGLSMGQKYEQINWILNELAKRLDIDLWTLDALLFAIVEQLSEDDSGVKDSSEQLLKGEETKFGLERHLHEFLRDNWRLTELAREWEIYSEPGDDTAGYEYPTDVGRIDILARHKTRAEWLVIELKRGQSTDQTVGQVLRYMGWVRRKMARPDEKVKGMIIARNADKGLLYAVEAMGTERISVMEYEVQFQLKAIHLDRTEEEVISA